MKIVKSRALAAGAIAALCLSPLAACGSDSSTDTKSGSSSTSSEKTSGGDHLTKDNFAKEIAEAMQDAGSGHMTMDMGGQGSGEGDFSYEGGKTATSMSINAMGQAMKMIMVDQTVYMQMPGLTPAGKWSRIDKDTPGLGEMIDQMGGMTPDKSIEQMEKGLTSFKHVGSEKIDGVDTEKYEITLDAAKMLEGMGQEVPTTGVPEELTYVMYVDEDNLPRRMTMDLGGQSMTIDMSDWGKDVEVEAPPAGDVVPFAMPGQQAQ